MLGAAILAAAAAGAEAGPAFGAAATASSLVTRPPRPEPATSAAAIPFSSRILRADGLAVPAGAAAAGAALAAGAAAAFGASAAGAAAPALASVSMRGDQFAGDDGFAIALDDLDQHASARRRDFQHDLVGFDIDQDFIASNGFANSSFSRKPACLRQRTRTTGELELR